MESVQYRTVDVGIPDVGSDVATAHYPETEVGDLHRRLVILRVGLLLVVALLGLRLWHLQIREGPYYRD